MLGQGEDISFFIYTIPEASNESESVASELTVETDKPEAQRSIAQPRITSFSTHDEIAGVSLVEKWELFMDYLGMCAWNYDDTIDEEDESILEFVVTGEL